MKAAGDHHGQRLRSLTFLRFVAAVMVVGVHTAGSFGFTADSERQPLQLALSSSVSFFFLLSGFLLTWNYGARLASGWQGDYFRARIARIFPLYLCVLFAMALLDPVFAHGWRDPAQLGFFPLHVLLVQSWWPVSMASVGIFIGPSWSLSTEWAFYLAFPLLLVALQSHPRWLALGVVGCALLMVTFAHQMAPALGPSSALFEAIQPFARLPEFVLGMWLGDRLRRGEGAAIGARGARAEFAAFALVIAWLYFHERIVHPALAVSPYLYDWLKHTGAAPVWALAIATMARSSGPLARTFRRPAFVMLGEMSFAVFLIHLPLLRFRIWAQLQGP
ncbi:MAG: acyltransferase, partial [Casimicrobiaceae bacterium]